MNTYHLRQQLPDSFFLALHQAASDHTRSEWIAGDTDNLMWEYVFNNRLCDEHGKPYTREHVHSLVGAHFGVGASMARKYAAVAEHYPKDARAKYDVLPFSHFALALEAQYQDIDILEMSLRRMDEIGRWPSVEWLRMQVNDPVQAYEQQVEAIAAAPFTIPTPPGEMDEYIEQVEQTINEDAAYMLRTLERSITTMIEKLVDRLPLPKESRRRIAELLGEIKRELERVKLVV